MGKDIEYYRTIKLKINCSKYDYNRLHQCNKESAIIWNECLKQNMQLFKMKNKLMNKTQLQKLSQSISTQVICAKNKEIVAYRLFDAYKAISKARKRGRIDEEYPHRYKKFYATRWNYQYLFPNYDTNTINLTTTRYIGEDNKKHNGKQIVLKFKTAIPKDIKILELKFENGCFYAYIIYETIQKINISENNNISAIDLGEIHSITSIDSNNNQLIITGRMIRSIKQYRNKKQAEIYEKISHCKKGSRQYKKYKKAYAKIKSKCNRKLYYYHHKLTKMYTDWAIEKGISVVLVGDVEGISENTKINNIANSNIRQKLKQWEYGTIYRLLEYKLGLEGIKLIKVNEAYTSKTCPVCGKLNTVRNRDYICNCGYKNHRDINGAFNILKFNTDLKLQLPYGNIKYLRIA